MINTKCIALSGIGFGSRAMVNSGYTYQYLFSSPTPTYTPITSSGSGGRGGTRAGNIAIAYVNLPYDSKDRIRVKIKYNGREWEEEYEYDKEDPLSTELNEHIVANFVRLNPVVAEVSFMKTLINTKNIFVKVRKL